MRQNRPWATLAFTAPNLCWACALASPVTFLTGDHVMQIGFGQISPSASSTRDLGTRLYQFINFVVIVCFSYSVIVQLVESCQHLETEKQENTTPCRQLSWSQLGGVSRVNEQAAKVFTWSLRIVKHPLPSLPLKERNLKLNS